MNIRNCQLAFIILFIFLFNYELITCVDIKLTTKDKKFKKIYHPTYIKDGDGKTFPKENEFAFVHISIYDAATNELYHTTKAQNYPYLHLMGHRYPTAICFGEVLERMTLGEETYFICPPQSMFGDNLGMGGLIPGGIDLGVLIELLEIHSYDEVMKYKEQMENATANAPQGEALKEENEKPTSESGAEAQSAKKEEI